MTGLHPSEVTGEEKRGGKSGGDFEFVELVLDLITSTLPVDG